MLKQLTIQNYVLVEHLDIGFSSGLTTITGESGAGKSILLGALSLLLGERARSDTVRPGATKADISAEFALSANAPLQQKLIADELTVAMSCVLTRLLAEKARQSFQKGGFAAPIPSEKIMRAILQRNIFGDCSEDGLIPDGQSLGERY